MGKSATPHFRKSSYFDDFLAIRTQFLEARPGFVAFYAKHRELVL